MGRGFVVVDTGGQLRCRAPVGAFTTFGLTSIVEDLRVSVPPRANARAMPARSAPFSPVKGRTVIGETTVAATVAASVFAAAWPAWVTVNPATTAASWAGSSTVIVGPAPGEGSTGSPSDVVVVDCSLPCVVVVTSGAAVVVVTASGSGRVVTLRVRWWSLLTPRSPGWWWSPRVRWWSWSPSRRPGGGGHLGCGRGGGDLSGAAVVVVVSSLAWGGGGDLGVGGGGVTSACGGGGGDLRRARSVVVVTSGAAVVVVTSAAVVVVVVVIHTRSHVVEFVARLRGAVLVEVTTIPVDRRFR